MKPLILALLLVLLSLVPQVNLWAVRGRDWNGSYVVMQGDEPLYSAYIRSLIDSRPRRNDPFSDTSPAVSETAFSVQFVPAYAIAFLARLFNFSASTVMIWLSVFSALSSALAVFWLIKSVTGVERLASAATLAVLCLGGLAGGHGLLGIMLKSDITISALPFLRRYQPAATFPLFFVFQTLCWKAFGANPPRRRTYSIGAGLCLAILVFSYFYLWTAAVAWLMSFTVIWCYLRNGERRKGFEVAAIVGAVTLPAIGLYGYLLTQRSSTLDQLQTLVHTRTPDLFRVPEVIALTIIATILMAWRQHRIDLSSPGVVYALSAALVPFIVFNQQILTGRSMQVFHYEVFVVNYLVLVALIIVLNFWIGFSRRALIWLAVLSFMWGFVEVGVVSKLTWAPRAAVADSAVPVFKELRKLPNGIVYSPDLTVSRFLPTWTSQSTLLDMGGLDFGSVSAKERKGFLYQHLYYSSTSVEEYRASLNGDPGTEGYARSVVFGHERVTRELGNHRPIETNEVEREVESYRSYVVAFSQTEVLKRPLSYAVVPNNSEFNFSRIDELYERDQGQPFGAYTLYRLHTR